MTFLASALLISGLVLSNGEARDTEEKRQPAAQTWRDIVDGLKFIRANPLVRGVMTGLAGGLLGGGSIVPLGAVFASDILKADTSAYGFLQASLGIGAGIGVVTLLWLQRRLPREAVFTWAVIATGVAIGVIAWLSTLALTILLVAAAGAAAGCAYVTGFTLLQESVADEMRGRTFATLYTVVHACLLLSLTLSPFIAALLDRLAKGLFNGQISIGSAELSLPGVRLALWAGGGLTVISGFAARRGMRKNRLEATSA